MLLQMASFCSFIWLSNIPLYICKTFSLFPCQQTFRLLPCLYKLLFKHLPGTEYDSKQYRNEICLHREKRCQVERKDSEMLKINACIFYFPYFFFAIHLLETPKPPHSEGTFPEKKMRSPFCSLSHSHLPEIVFLDSALTTRSEIILRCTWALSEPHSPLLASCTHSREAVVGLLVSSSN